MTSVVQGPCSKRVFRPVLFDRARNASLLSWHSDSWLCISCRGTIHRALFDAAVRELRNAKPQGAREPRLILIKRAERTSSKSEGRSDMQDVQGTSAEEPGLCSGNPPGMCEGRRK